MAKPDRKQPVLGPDDVLGWHPSDAEFELYLQTEVIHAKANLEPSYRHAGDTLHSHETCQKALKELGRA